MSRKVILSRKRAEVEEESQKRTRLEEDVAQILQNISKEIVIIPVPFHQQEVDETHMNKKVFLTKTLANHLSKNEDFVFIYHDALNQFNNMIQKYRELPPMSVDKNYIPKVYFAELIQNLIDNSLFKSYFKSKILNPTNMPKMEYKDVIALFRTHVYDKTISGIENQEASIYDQPCKITEYLADFLTIPHDTKIRRIEVYNKICEYIESKSLVQEKNNKKVIILDVPLRQILMMSNICIDYYILYDFIRQHIIYDNTKRIVRANLETELPIFEEYYVNSENKRHGPYFLFSNNMIKLKTYYVNGILCGVQQTYYDNRMNHSIKYYLNNKYEGLCILYDTHGKVVVLIEYKNNIAIKTHINF